MEASYICAHCKNEGVGEMKMIPGCNHYFCQNCTEKPELKIEKGQTCPARGSLARCGQKIKDLVPIFVPSGVEDILEKIQEQISEMKNEKELLKNVRDGIASFTRNLINASSQLIERNVRFLQSEQQEKSEILKQGTDFGNKAATKINELVTRAERMKKGQIQKTQQQQALLQKNILEVSAAVTGAFDSKLTFIGNNIFDPKLKGKLFVHEPNEYGTFAGAVHKDPNPGLLSKDFFPPTYLPSDYFSTHLIPPYMEYVFVIPDFLDSGKYDTPIISPLFHTLPFPFKWRFLVYPRGAKPVAQNRDFVSAHIELVNGNERKVGQEFRNLFPEYNQSENFPHFTFNPSASSQSSSSSSSSTSSSSSSSCSFSTSPSAPFDPSMLSVDSIAALMRNPFVFDYKIQIVAQKPSAKAEQRVYTYESTADFEFMDREKQGKSDFVSRKVVESGFVWGEDQKFKNSVHFVFGIRFPSFKREYEALRVAYVLPDEYKKDGK